MAAQYCHRRRVRQSPLQRTWSRTSGDPKSLAFFPLVCYDVPMLLHRWIVIVAASCLRMIANIYDELVAEWRIMKIGCSAPRAAPAAVTFILCALVLGA